MTDRIRRALALTAAALAAVFVSGAAVAAPTYETLAALQAAVPSPTAGQSAWIKDGSGATTVGSQCLPGGTEFHLCAWNATAGQWQFVMAGTPAGGATAKPATYIDATRVRFDTAGGELVGDTLQDAVAELDLRTGDPPTCSSPPDGRTCVDRATGITYTGIGDASVPSFGRAHHRGAEILNADGDGILTLDGTLGVTDEWALVGDGCLQALPGDGVSRAWLYLRKVGFQSNVDFYLQGTASEGAEVALLVYDSAGSLMKSKRYRTHIQAGDCFQLGVSYDGTATGDPVTLIYNGAAWPDDWRATSGHTDTTGTMADATGRSWRIGVRSGTSFDGVISQAAIFDRAPTPAEWAQLYNGGPDFDWRALDPLHYVRLCARDGATVTAPTNYGRGTLPAWGAGTGTPVCVSEWAPAAAREDLIRGEEKVAAFGDSRTLVGGAFPDLSYVRFLPRDYLVENEGVGGDDCTDVQTRLTAYLAGTPTADTIVIECGANDAAAGGFSASASLGVIESMCAAVVASGRTCVVLSTIPIMLSAGDATRSANVDALAAAIMASPNLTTAQKCDVHQAFRDLDTSGETNQDALYTDGIHPTDPDGMEFIARHVAPCLPVPTF